MSKYKTYAGKEIVLDKITPLPHDTTGLYGAPISVNGKSVMNFTVGGDSWEVVSWDWGQIPHTIIGVASNQEGKQENFVMSLWGEFGRLIEEDLRKLK